MGFQQSKIDSYLLIFNASRSQLFVFIYVDDIIITSSNSQEIKLIWALDFQFSLKDLGQLYYLLGIIVHKLEDESLFLTQKKYIQDLFLHGNMINAKPSSSPTVSHTQFFTLKDIDMHDCFLYQNVVGGLQYITMTKPNLAYCVNKVC